MAPWRLTWRLKAIIPIAAVLLIGLLMFVWITLRFDPDAHAMVMVIASAGAIAICAITLIVLAVFVHGPMIELHTMLHKLRGGEMDVSVGFAGRDDEIGDLGRMFNDTVRQLRDSRDEIARLHRTQMSRAEHFAMMGELAAGVAHEIRNPLAGISGVMDVVRRDIPPTSPALAVLDEVKEEVARINRIVSDLLKTARPRPPEFRPGQLNHTAEDAFRFVEQQVDRRRIKMTFIPAVADPIIEHDESLLHQVLLNLLLNAAQSIIGSGEVALRVEVAEAGAALRVSDNGRGIKPENLGNVFRPFFTTKRQGTGLGLSLSRRIVEDHGGTIEVLSEVDKGTEFIVRLPAVRAVAELVGV